MAKKRIGSLNCPNCGNTIELPLATIEQLVSSRKRVSFKKRGPVTPIIQDSANHHAVVPPATVSSRHEFAASANGGDSLGTQEIIARSEIRLSSPQCAVSRKISDNPDDLVRALDDCEMHAAQEAIPDRLASQVRDERPQYAVASGAARWGRAKRERETLELAGRKHYPHTIGLNVFNGRSGNWDFHKLINRNTTVPFERTFAFRIVGRSHSCNTLGLRFVKQKHGRQTIVQEPVETVRVGDSPEANASDGEKVLVAVACDDSGVLSFRVGFCQTNKRFNVSAVLARPPRAPRPNRTHGES